jgi:hypothetical protein
MPCSRVQREQVAEPHYGNTHSFGRSTCANQPESLISRAGWRGAHLGLAFQSLPERAQHLEPVRIALQRTLQDFQAEVVQPCQRQEAPAWCNGACAAGLGPATTGASMRHRQLNCRQLRQLHGLQLGH